MELALYLGQVLGLYLIIAGIIIMFRRRYFLPVVGAFIEERLTRLIWASVELLGGLFFVIGFQDWSSLYTGILSLFGWMLLLEGVVYLALPDDYVEAMIKKLNVRAWYIGGGIGSVVVGVYLAAVGFGLIS